MGQDRRDIVALLVQLCNSPTLAGHHRGIREAKTVRVAAAGLLAVRLHMLVGQALTRPCPVPAVLLTHVEAPTGNAPYSATKTSVLEKVGNWDICNLFAH